MTETSAKPKKESKKSNQRNGASMTRHPRKTEAAAKETQKKADKEKKPTTKQLLARADDEINRMRTELDNRNETIRLLQERVKELDRLAQSLRVEHHALANEAEDAAAEVARAMTSAGIELGNITENPELVAAVSAVKATGHTVTLEVHQPTKSLVVVARPIVFDPQGGNTRRRQDTPGNPDRRERSMLVGG